jgi:hypothetical protein
MLIIGLIIVSSRLIAGKPRDCSRRFYELPVQLFGEPAKKNKGSTPAHIANDTILRTGSNPTISNASTRCFISLFSRLVHICYNSINPAQNPCHSMFILLASVHPRSNFTSTIKHQHMKLTNNTFIIATAIIVTISACKKNNDPSPQQPTITPVATAVGTPDGTAISQNIGSSGGTITSSDGTMEIVIPSGALSANTNISIQPITNNTPNGRGKAYRCLPDGTQFAKNITIKFHYTSEELAITRPEYMLMAFQNADHYWQVIDNVSNDVATKTISASVNHFTDFSAFDALSIEPGNLYLKPGESANLKVKATGMDLSNTVILIGEILEKPEVWKVNGVTGGNSTSGTIKASADRTFATYTAPSSVPANNPVAITAEINFPFVVNGQRFNKGILQANAYIGGSKYHVLVESAYNNNNIGTSTDTWRMTDKATFDVTVTGTAVAIDNLVNSDATITLVSAGTAPCTSSVVSPGTGGINIKLQDFASSFYSPGVGPQSQALVNLVYLGTPQITQPIFRTSCNGNAPVDHEVVFATPMMVGTSFVDNGTPQVIDVSVPAALFTFKYTITPVK